MASVSSIKIDITTLGDYELQELFNYIGEMLTFGSLKGPLIMILKSRDLVRGRSALTISQPQLLKMVNWKINKDIYARLVISHSTI